MESIQPADTEQKPTNLYASKDQTGGPSYPVELGRLDGKMSTQAIVKYSLPSPTLNLDQLNSLFFANGLSQTDMIALSGAHTIGVTHCDKFIRRIYTFKQAPRSKAVWNPPMNLCTRDGMDEAAARLTDASVETPEYRSINIFVNFYSDPEYKLQVERTNFFPQPKFDAAIVRFKLKQISEYPPVASPKTFFSMVNSAFNGKRKMLRRSLHHLCSSTEIESALDNIGLPITSRPAELTLNDFVRLHNNLVKQ